MASIINASSSGSGGIVQTADASGVLQLQSNGTTALTVNTDASVTLAGALTTTGYANLPNTFGFKNRIINGGMTIDQRNAGASVSNTTSDTWAVDRFAQDGSSAGKFTAQQTPSATETGYATRVAAGFRNYLAFTSSAATTVSSSNYYRFWQIIEGFNTADLAWGTANAKSVTLSFWVNSSLTGTFGGALRNANTDRIYPFSYTISSANTWEQKTITIAGDTTGTWGTTNGTGIQIIWSLGCGSARQATAGSWITTAGVFAPTGETQVVATSGATFYITGVQLEKGSTATSFDFRSYGTELALCQRYYYRIQASTSATYFAPGFCYSATNGIFNVTFPVPMRTPPTSLETSGNTNNYRIYSTSANSFTSTAITFNNAETVSASLGVTVASGLTNSAGAFFIAAASSAYLGWSAEL